MPLLDTNEGPDHFSLSPSQAKRWLECPGSRFIPDERPPGPAAARGSVLHELAANILYDYIGGRVDLGSEEFWNTSPDHATLRPYIEFCISLKGDWLIEQKIQHPKLHNFGGTLDFVALTPQSAYVVDLKTGRHPVSAQNNSQLLSYLTLARAEWPSLELFMGVIVQVRPGHQARIDIRTHYQDDLNN